MKAKKNKFESAMGGRRKCPSAHTAPKAGRGLWRIDLHWHARSNPPKNGPSLLRPSPLFQHSSLPYLAKMADDAQQEHPAHAPLHRALSGQNKPKGILKNAPQPPVTTPGASQQYASISVSIRETLTISTVPVCSGTNKILL